jgi:hypothetical protein
LDVAGTWECVIRDFNVAIANALKV